MTEDSIDKAVHTSDEWAERFYKRVNSFVQRHPYITIGIAALAIWGAYSLWKPERRPSRGEQQTYTEDASWWDTKVKRINRQYPKHIKPVLDNLVEGGKEMIGIESESKAYSEPAPHSPAKPGDAPSSPSALGPND